MKNKQTAVDWLIKEIESLITIETFQRWKVIKEQAKEMEKDQTEISDEEIEKFASDFYDSNGSESIFIMGAKWYRKKLKNK